METGSELSEREREILRLVATGASNKEIAQALVISPNTVKVHLRNIFAKIEVTSRTEATLYALRMGLVENIPTDNPAGVAAEVEEESESTSVEQVETPPVRPKPAVRPWIVALFVLALLGIGLTSGILIRQMVMTPTPAAAVTPTVQRWQSLTSLTSQRKGMAATAYEEDIYLIGGETASGVTAEVERYQSASDSWKTCAPKPLAVSDVQAAVLAEKIYVPGGRTSNGQPSNAVEVYDPREDRWEQRAPLPENLSGYALVALEGQLYLFGGWNGQTYSANVYSYEPINDRWTSLTPMRSARAFASAVAVGGRIYLIGGTDGKTALNDNLVYFPTRDRAGETPWEDRTPLPDGRYSMGAIGLADQIYVVGGYDKIHSSKDLSPLIYTPLSDQWSQFDQPPQPVGANPAVAAQGPRLHIFGGDTGSGATASHLSYQAIYNVLLPLIQQQQQQP